MQRRPTLSYVLTLAFGLALGLGLAQLGNPRLLAVAGPGDRPAESAVASGPVSVQINPSTKVAFQQDALYFLDYKGGRLLATVPEQRQSPAGTRVLNAFASRDLVADFRLPPGVTPHFLMTVGQLGVGGFGWAPLYVFETGTRQVAAYRAQPPVLGGGGDGSPQFDLLEIRPLR